MLRRYFKSLVCLSIFIVLPSHAQTKWKATGPVYGLADVDTYPAAVPGTVPKRDPAKPKAKKILGVYIWIVVDDTGIPRNPHVDGYYPKQCIADAMAVLDQMRFYPATRKGKPVAVQMKTEIEVDEP